MASLYVGLGPRLVACLRNSTRRSSAASRRPTASELSGDASSTIEDAHLYPFLREDAADAFLEVMPVLVAGDTDVYAAHRGPLSGVKRWIVRTASLIHRTARGRVAGPPPL